MAETRRAVLAGAAAVAVGLGTAWANARRMRQDGRPNLLLILTDDQGYDDLGCVAQPGQESGAGVRTPHLDTMASTGVRLDQFYVAAPVCTPSRAALMTGCYPPRVGFGAEGGPDDIGVLSPSSTNGLDPREVTLADLLGGAGYDTALVGKWHLGHQPHLLPTRQGFADFYGVPYSHNYRPLPLLQGERVVRSLADEPDLTGVFTRGAKTWLGARSGERPFFLYVAYTAPHAPYVLPGEWRRRTGGGRYADALAQADNGVGQLLAQLDATGFGESTLAFFTSDNGPWLEGEVQDGRPRKFRGGKGETTEGGVREPAIVRWPDRVPAGVVGTGLSATIDLLPTMARWAEVPLPAAPIDGVDATACWCGGPSARPNLAYYARGRLEAVRDASGWKRTFAVDGRTPPVPAALYDLERDPKETTDRSSEAPERVAQLDAVAAGLRQELGDALTNVAGTGIRSFGAL